MKHEAGRAWAIGEAIEAGIDERAAIDRSALTVAAGTGAAGGIAAATATGLGGVGLAAAGGAIGIGAATAVAAPAVVTTAAGFGIFKGVRGVIRKDAVKELIKYFQKTGQAGMVERIYTLEGKGQLIEGRRPPAWGSADAVLHLLTQGRTSASVGLFCSPGGHFVLTYDLSLDHWAYVKLVDNDDFTGCGMDPGGHEFRLDDLKDIKHLISSLKRREVFR